jgi:hypothetical protein
MTSGPISSFFAYGIFRSDEIAFPVIEPFVDSVTPATVRGRLLERDGLHLLDLDGTDEIEGELIRFGASAADAARAAIESLEPEKIYRWARCDVAVDGGVTTADVLVARSPSHGTHRASSPFRSRDSPLFVEALDEIEAVVREPIRAGGNYEIRDFFRHQMAYLLLWSAIERYCTLRWGFGDNPVARVNRLAREQAFVQALKKHVRESQRVYRADRPGNTAERLDPDDPARSIKFYYQVRSNISHRGKSIYDERALVAQSLQELSRIFRDVLDATLGPPRDLS